MIRMSVSGKYCTTLVCGFNPLVSTQIHHLLPFLEPITLPDLNYLKSTKYMSVSSIPTHKRSRPISRKHKST